MFLCRVCGNNEQGELNGIAACLKCKVAVPRKVDALAPGAKFDDGKLRWRLLPWRGLVEVAKVAEYGARKYSEGGWRHVRPFVERYSDALIRHVAAYAMGETHDPESGIHHLAHAAWNCLALLSGPGEKS
jgi:hypothetical protein